MKYISLKEIPEFQSKNRQEKKAIRKAACATIKAKIYVSMSIVFFILILLANYIRYDVINTTENWTNWIFPAVLFPGVCLLNLLVGGFIINPQIQQIMNEIKIDRDRTPHR